jgi:hypothetical protein
MCFLKKQLLLTLVLKGIGRETLKYDEHFIPHKHHLPVAEIPELPAVFQRAKYLPDRDMDAENCHALAGLSYDRISISIGTGKFCRPDTDIPSRSLCRCSN